MSYIRVTSTGTIWPYSLAQLRVDSSPDDSGIEGEIGWWVAEVLP